MVSCEKPASEIREMNAKWFSFPNTAGTLPNGKVVKFIWYQQKGSPQHCIYFVEDVVSVNSDELIGKSHVNKVVVMINGVRYEKVKDNKTESEDEKL